jgi:5-methylthioadenosine/S-adenosylhomocysteine deaminase
MDMLADMRPAIYVANFLGAGEGEPLSADDLLRMATIEGARAIGLGDRVGTIEPGKRADLVVLDLRDPRLMQVSNVTESVAYYASGRNVTHTIVDGRIVYERGQPTLFDEHEVLGAGRDGAAEWLRRSRPLIGGSPLADRVDERAYGVA